MNLSVCARSSPGSRNQFPEVSLVSTEGLGIFGRLASAVSTPIENWPPLCPERKLTPLERFVDGRLELPIRT